MRKSMKKIWRLLAVLLAVCLVFGSVRFSLAIDSDDNTEITEETPEETTSLNEEEENAGDSSSEEDPGESSSEEPGETTSSEEEPEGTPSEENPDENDPEGSSSEREPEGSSSEEEPEGSSSEEEPEGSSSEEEAGETSSEEEPEGSSSEEEPEGTTIEEEDGESLSEEGTDDSSVAADLEGENGDENKKPDDGSNEDDNLNDNAGSRYVPMLRGAPAADPDEDKDEEEGDSEEPLRGPAENATEPTNLRVDPTKANGIPVTINVFYNDQNDVKMNQLFLPGNVVLDQCFLSWDGGATATVNGQEYESGACPILSVNTGQTVAYTFKYGQNGEQIKDYSLITYRGSTSAKVHPVCIEVEGTPTITDMDASPDHSVECSGTIYIDGTPYEMTKIKGRGNATWTDTEDKKPYNVTLKTAIDFGIDTPATKKWSFLAEAIDPSLLGNRAGFWLAHQLGIGQDTASADVWMNGEYQGCYTVTPKTDSFVTANGYMIEQDNYKENPVSQGGDPQFTLNGLQEYNGDWLSVYNRITVKKIGSNLANDNTAEAYALNTIKPWLQDALDAILSDTGYNSKGKYYTDYIDLESFAKFYLVEEYVKNYDIQAGSLLSHRDGTTDSDKLIAGPMWDLDNALGSTNNNNLLGNQAKDRRSAEGIFIPLVEEQKTTIYKNLYVKHADFRTAVEKQYTWNKAAFDKLPETMAQLISEIADSANMNQHKVINLTVPDDPYNKKNNHYYENDFSVGSYPYQQQYRKTTDFRNDWSVYVGNMYTYIDVRTKWFAGDANFYNAAYDCDGNHVFVETEHLEATCARPGYIIKTCTKCEKTERVEIPELPHTFANGKCTVCDAVIPVVTFSCGEGASVTVYHKQDLTGDFTENAETAYPRIGDTGEIDLSDGQVNFVVNLESGYKLDKVTPVGADGSYNKLKPPADTGVTNGYRLTKVKGDVTINITTEKLPPAPPTPAFKTQSVVLSGKIGVNFYMDLPEIEGVDYSQSYMTFEISGKGTITERDDYDPNDKAKTGEYYGFTCYINSIQMADTITATFHYGDDLTVQKDYSIKEYLATFDEYSSQFDDKTVAAVQALADYGHYIQPYLAGVRNWTIGRDYAEMDKYYQNYQELCTNQYISGVKQALKDYAFNIGKSEDFNADIKETSYSLVMDSETAINLYFAPANGYSGSFTVTVDGNPAEYSMKGTRYLVKISGISAHELGRTHTVVVTTDHGSATIKVSALSYVEGLLTVRNDKPAQYAAISLYRYYLAAEGYLIDNEAGNP